MLDEDEFESKRERMMNLSKADNGGSQRNASMYLDCGMW